MLFSAAQACVPACWPRRRIGSANASAPHSCASAGRF